MPALSTNYSIHITFQLSALTLPLLSPKLEQRSAYKSAQQPQYSSENSVKSPLPYKARMTGLLIPLPGVLISVILFPRTPLPVRSSIYRSEILCGRVGVLALLALRMGTVQPEQ